MSILKKQKNLGGPIPIDKERANAISDYIKKSIAKSKRTAFVIENGRSKEKTAFFLPRELLRLNPSNHRFTTAVDDLIEERSEMKNFSDFDMAKKDDVEAIRNMLRGIKPVNADRKERYKKILQEVEIHSETHGGNGLKVAGIVTADGMYINGNRRDTVLEDLQQRELKKKKGDPSKFDNIDVVICDENITYSDIRQMEISEQVSVSLRDEYDYMNTAMLIQEEYDNLIAQKGKEKKDLVIKTLASRIEGKSQTAIIEYLDFLEFVNLVLKTIGLPGEYHKINTKIPGESKPVTTIIKEWQNKWKNAKPGPLKFLQINLAAAYCQGVFKTAKEDSDEQNSRYKFTSRNHRIFKAYAKSKKAKDIIENPEYWKTHDFTSNASIEIFGERIQRADEFKKNESWMTKPAKVLDGINDSLEIIDSALVGTQSAEVKILLNQAKAHGYFDNYKNIIARIEKKLNTKSKTGK